MAARVFIDSKQGSRRRNSAFYGRFPVTLARCSVRSIAAGPALPGRSGMLTTAKKTLTTI
jgi:hypothetical protein